MSQQHYQRFSPIGNYSYIHLTAAASNVKVGVAGRGAYLGSVLVGQPGTSVVLTLMNGTDVIGTFNIAAGDPPRVFDVCCEAGLYYTLAGSGTISLTVTYLDYLPI